jgi:hypothetical protein
MPDAGCRMPDAGCRGPVHILSLGAGVQSSCLALMAAAGEIGPMPAAAIFADTQAEPASVYRWLDWLEKQLPFPVKRITHGSLPELVTTVKARRGGGYYVENGIPAFVLNPDGSQGLIQRQCTRTFKIDPIRKCAREIGQIKRGQKTVGVIQWIGISLEEIYRMKDSREPWQQNRWPLVERRMNRADCKRWMAARGFPSAPRSACYFCPYHSDAEWRRLQREEPEEFAKAVDLEVAHNAAKRAGQIRGQIFLHRTMKPLSEVNFSSEAERGQTDLWQNECEGICGV